MTDRTNRPFLSIGEAQLKLGDETRMQFVCHFRGSAQRTAFQGLGFGSVGHPAARSAARCSGTTPAGIASDSSIGLTALPRPVDPTYVPSPCHHTPRAISGHQEAAETSVLCPSGFGRRATGLDRHACCSSTSTWCTTESCTPAPITHQLCSHAPMMCTTNLAHTSALRILLMASETTLLTHQRCSHTP
jgi:hypothetical protein